MAFNKNRAKATLNDGGSIFGDLDQTQHGKFELLKKETTYSLGRFEVMKKTKNHNQAFVLMELKRNEEEGYRLYAGYGTALGNQLIKLIQGEFEARTAGVFDSATKAWTENHAEVPVQFEQNTNENGTYWVMRFVD